MKLSINHMVCPRCVEAVEEILSEMGVNHPKVELGRVWVERPLKEDELSKFQNLLQQRGFELVLDRETELVNLVKKCLIQYLKAMEEGTQLTTISAYVSENTDYNYSYLSKVFSDHQGRTIENYLIELKIERVKELLGFNRYTLSEIAWKLKYSSVQYLSNQFKSVTGLTVTQYLKQNHPDRKSLDQL